MITKKVIDYLYKKYRKRPTDSKGLDLGKLLGSIASVHDIEVSNDHVIINSIEGSSPFHDIALKSIHAIVEFEESFAIVLHSSIVFLNKSDNQTNIHVKAPRRSLWGIVIGRILKNRSLGSF